MTDINFSPGTSETVNFTVQHNDLASVISPYESDKFPNVLATSRVVAFMEIACARLMIPHLPANQLSVGVRIDVTHSAPTPADAKVTVEAKLVEKRGKIFVFDIVASDAGGEIGKARHERAVIDGSRLESGAVKRVGQAKESKA